MPAPPPEARCFTGRVECVDRCGDDGGMLVVGPSDPLRELSEIRASRFFMLWRNDDVSPPFSIHRQRGGALACGPDPMLEAGERMTRERGLDCWGSLETRMGGGVGIRNGWPVETRRDGPMGAWPNATCRLEGPAFSTEAIVL